jgi:hypothetical protein
MCSPRLGHIFRRALDARLCSVRQDLRDVGVVKHLLLDQGLCAHECGMKDSLFRLYEKQIVGGIRVDYSRSRCC